MIERNPKLLCSLTLVMLALPSPASADEAADLLNRSKAAIESGDADLGIAYSNRILRLSPNEPAAYVARGWAFFKKGNYDACISDSGQALALNPNAETKSWAYNNRAIAYYSKNRDNYERAIADCNAAIEANPKNDQPYNEIAWILATNPRAMVRNGKVALEYAQKAYSYNDKDPYIQSCLAAAYAECGNFAEAITWAKKAIATRKESDPALGKNCQQLLLYL